MEALRYTRRILRHVGTLATLSLVSFTCHAAPTPWVLGAAPRHSRESTTLAPLATLIARVAGRPIKIWQAKHSWFTYAHKVATGHFALTLDGATFTGWRDQYRGYHPIVRLSGHMRFVAITADDSDLHKVRDLDGYVVCAAPLPNIATMAILKHTSSINAPYINPMGGIAKNYHGLVSGFCKAAILPERFFQALPLRARAHFREVYRTRRYPALALSSGPQVSRAVRARIRQILLSPAGEDLAAKIFPGRRFVIPARGTYRPYARELADMVFFKAMVAASHIPAQPQTTHLKAVSLAANRKESQ